MIKNLLDILPALLFSSPFAYSVFLILSFCLSLICLLVFCVGMNPKAGENEFDVEFSSLTSSSMKLQYGYFLSLAILKN